MRCLRSANAFVGAGVCGSAGSIGRVGSAAAAWTPASLSPKWWAVPLDLAQVTYNTQPSVTDGDMEAVGVANWAVRFNATRTKESGSPIGSGTQVLRVTAVAGGNASVTQTTTGYVVANTYRIGCWAKPDGAGGTPRLYFREWNILVDGTASSTWQYLSGNYVAPATSNAILPYVVNPDAGEYCDFDDVTATNISINALAPDAASSLSGSFVNATAAQMPWINQSTSWIEFDGTADKIAYNGAASGFTFLHYSSAGSNFPVFTAVFPVNIDLTAANGVFYTGTVAGRGFLLTVAADGSVTCEVYGSAGTLASAVSSAGAVSTNTATVLMVWSDGSSLKVYQDGSEIASDSSYTGTPESGDCDVAPNLGYDGTNYTKGQLIPPLFLDYAADASTRTAIFDYYATQLGI